MIFTEWVDYVDNIIMVFTYCESCRMHTAGRMCAALNVEEKEYVTFPSCTLCFSLQEVGPVNWLLYLVYCMSARVIR